MSQIKIAAFYKFVQIDDVASLRDSLKQMCADHHIRGTILLASEGINGTIAGKTDDMNAVIGQIRDDGRFSDLDIKFSTVDDMPFYRLKVQLKKEIISFGQTLLKTDQVGHHIEPQQWNDLINDPDVILLDTRNDYEVDVGTFEGAIDPKIESFHDFKTFVKDNLNPQENKKVAMFCTGGIRCEKASAYMLQQGFENVYQLHGGILKYLESVPENESQWQGECFIFDQRVSLDHNLERGSHQLCYSCQHPLNPTDLESPHFEQGVCCPYCYDSLDEEKRARLQERQQQVTLAQQRGEPHIGRVDPRSRGPKD
jgi:UPF0176 protein